MSLFEKIRIVIKEENAKDPKKSKAQNSSDKIKKIKKDADRLVRKAEKGDKGARKEILDTVDKKFKKMSPSAQNKMADDMINVQRKMGRKLNPKTGNFEGPDTEFQKSISKVKGSKTGKKITSGPVSVTAGPKIRQRVEKIRDTRATKAGMPDPFKSKTKFDQKKFDKSIGGAKKPTSAAAPGLFGKGDTKGQMNVKGMEKKAFKITKPRDIKLPKSFRDFQRNLQDYKDRDVPGGPRKYKQTELKFSSKKTTKPSGSRFDPDIGMAPPDKPKTKVVKQSEVSKKAKDFTKNINQTRNKKSFQSFKKQADASSDKLVSKREVVRSAPGTKDVKKIRDINKKIQATERISKGYDLASKGKGNLKSPVVVASDLKQVTDNTPKIKTPTRVGQKGYVRIPKRSKFFQKSIDFSKVPDDPRLKGIEKSSELRRLNKQMGQDQLLKAISRTKIGRAIASTKAGKLAIKGTSAVAKSAVKNPYTAAATVVGAGLLTQPNVRKGIKAALTGGGIGALTGAFAKDNRKNKPAEYGKKTYLKKGSISLSPSAPKSYYSKTMSSVKPYDFTKIDKKIKADQTAKKNALSASQKQKQRRGIA